MKKLLIIAVAALVAVSCTDKDQFTPAQEFTPQYVSLSYDTASTLASNASNRCKIYNVGGKYIKFSVVADDESKGTFCVTAGWVGDDSDDNQLAADIAVFGTKEVVEEGGKEVTIIRPFTSFEDVDFSQMPEEEEFKAIVSLPVADVDDPDVKGKTYAADPASYLVRYFDPDVEGAQPIYFVVLVPEIAMTETITATEVVTTPFGQPEVVLSSTFAEVVTTYIKQYDVLGNPIF